MNWIYDRPPWAPLPPFNSQGLGTSRRQAVIAAYNDLQDAWKEPRLPDVTHSFRQHSVGTEAIEGVSRRSQPPDADLPVLHSAEAYFKALYPANAAAGAIPPQVMENLLWFCREITVRLGEGQAIRNAAPTSRREKQQWLRQLRRIDPKVAEALAVPPCD